MCFSGLSTSRGDPGPAGDGQAGEVHADLVGSSVTTYAPKQFQTINGNAGNYWFNPGNFSSARVNALDAIANTDASQLAGQFTYGTFPRNGLRGPGYVNVDLAISKHFYIGEKLDTELRADMFNVFNHANFLNPDTSINDPQFGQVSDTQAARIIQIALHLRF